MNLCESGENSPSSRSNHAVFTAVEFALNLDSGLFGASKVEFTAKRGGGDKVKLGGSHYL